MRTASLSASGGEEHLSLTELRGIARQEASIVGSGVPPEIALVLGAAGVLSDQVATWSAFGLGLAVLALVGVRFARIEHLGPAQTIFAVLTNLALGLVLIGLKVLVVH